MKQNYTKFLFFKFNLSEPVEEIFRVTDKLEVIFIINSLNSRKAFGSPSILNNLLKLFKNEQSKPISLLANISFNMSMLPNILKTNLNPIFKNDDPAQCNNY